MFGFFLGFFLFLNTGKWNVFITSHK
jgi:hypothetical protein